MIMLKELSTLIGLCIGIFFTTVGLASMTSMFINRDQSLGRICLWGILIAFGITSVIAHMT